MADAHGWCGGDAMGTSMMHAYTPSWIIPLRTILVVIYVVMYSSMFMQARSQWSPVYGTYVYCPYQYHAKTTEQSVQRPSINMFCSCTVQYIQNCKLWQHYYRYYGTVPYRTMYHVPVCLWCQLLCLHSSDGSIRPSIACSKLTHGPLYEIFGAKANAIL